MIDNRRDIIVARLIELRTERLELERELQKMLIDESGLSVGDILEFMPSSHWYVVRMITAAYSSLQSEFMGVTVTCQRIYRTGRKKDQLARPVVKFFVNSDLVKVGALQSDGSTLLLGTATESSKPQEN